MKDISHLLLLGVATIICSCFHNNANTQIPSARLSFPANKNIIEIPFTRYRGWIIVKVSVNNSKKLSFILDTGAPIAVLANTSVENQLHLNISGNAMLAGGDTNKPVSVPLATSVVFKIGDIIINDGLMAVGAAGNTIYGVDGIIGKYLFDDAVIKIDWKNNKLILTKPELFSYTGNGNTLPIKILPSGHIFSDIDIESNGKKNTLKCDVDLGNRSGFMMDKSLDAFLNNNEKSIKNIIVSWGANGASYGDVKRTNIYVGSFKLNDVITLLSQFNQQAKNDSINANIGLSVLERFIPFFDYRRKRLILEKNDNFNNPFIFNRSGIILNPKQEAGYVVIADVMPSSPAADSDLQKDDEIILINGKNISSLQTDTISDLVQGKVSDTILITLLRKEKKIQSKIIMRKLI